MNLIDPNHELTTPVNFTPRLEELGGSHVLCGLARLIMCVAEVPFFYLSGPLIRRLGVRGVIALTQLAYLTRFIYYAVRLIRNISPIQSKIFWHPPFSNFYQAGV